MNNIAGLGSVASAGINRYNGFNGAYDNIPSIQSAYGLRRLVSSYAGSLVRLRRGSDNAESDFKYDSGGNLVTTAIATWLGGASGYVATWYDQSGNGNDVTQGTNANQPLYVASGQNGHPTIRFDGNNDYMQTTYATQLSQPFNIMIISKLGSTATQTIFHGITNDNSALLAAINSSDRWQIGAGSNIIGGSLSTSWIVFTTEFNSTSSDLWLSGTNTINGNAGTHDPTGLTLGARFDGAAAHSDQDTAEVIVADPVWDASTRGTAESIAADYWGITLS